MKSVMRSLIPLILIVSLQAQDNLPKYSVLKTECGDVCLASLNQLADRGYRVLAVGKYAILRLDATPPDTYHYLRVEVKGGPAKFTNWINEQGAHGYRLLLPAGLLEKAPHPRNYEYRNSPHGSGPSKGRELSSVVQDGYRPSGIVPFSNIFGTTAEVYFEREVGRPAVASPQVATAIEVADAMRADNVMKRVDELAQQGYRFLSPHLSNKGGGIAVMMEKCPDNCAGRYEYRYFDAKDATQVERDLNALGKDGFRVVRAALMWRPHLLERDTHEKRTFSYRALEASDAESLQRSLNSAAEEGYTPIDFVWHVGLTLQRTFFLVLEKETTASPGP